MRSYSIALGIVAVLGGFILSPILVGYSLLAAALSVLAIFSVRKIAARG